MTLDYSPKINQNYEIKIGPNILWTNILRKKNNAVQGLTTKSQ